MKRFRIFLAWFLVILTAGTALTAAATEPQADPLALYPIQPVSISYAAKGASNSTVHTSPSPSARDFF